MPSNPVALLTIDSRLRFVLYGISITLDIQLHASEIERVFTASKLNDSKEQHYDFHRTTRAIVTGRVEEYEPESVWISVEAKKFSQSQLDRLVEATNHASFGL